MKFIANLMEPGVDPGQFAREREAEGWDMVAASDHYFLGIPGMQRWFPHVWVSAAQMAAATTTIGITTTFANNLFRSPVEFVQASLTLQAGCGGRFEAGLGAGWSKDELDATGQRFPPARERADRYIEAIQIARALFDDASCQFDGEYYRINVEPTTGYEAVTPPALIGSLGGPRTIAGATPYLDRVEIKAGSVATRGGALDYATFAAIPRSDLVGLVDRVRSVREDVDLGFWGMCAAGEDELTKSLEPMFGPESLYGGFHGHPKKVAESLLGLEDYGFTHVQVSPVDSASFQLLAPHLFGG